MHCDGNGSYFKQTQSASTAHTSAVKGRRQCHQSFCNFRAPTWSQFSHFRYIPFPWGLVAPPTERDMMNSNPSLDQLSTRILRTYNGKETEDNWEQLEQLFTHSTQSLTSHGDATNAAIVNAFLKNISNVAFEQCLQSERTRLATSVMDLCKALHVFQKVDAVIWDQIMVSLLKVCERVNKVFVQRAKGSLQSLIGVIPPKISLARLMGGCSSVTRDCGWSQWSC